VGTPERVVRTYLWITGLFTLAASLIWGVNTLFLLDAGLGLFETFLANAAWTAGMVLFEIPTGLVADTRGRKASFLLSASVLAIGTLAYVGIAAVGGGLVPFVAASVLLGLGYTFYTGAVDAWLVDALRATGYRGALDRVFARAGMVAGAAMLVGTVAGGFLGQVDLALPYVVRAGLLVAALAVGWIRMHELGFAPRTLRWSRVTGEVRSVFRASLRHGWGHPAVRLFMIAGVAQGAVGAWAFYAWQPYLLDLLGRELIWVAGVVASLIALAGIAGNALVGVVTRPGLRRTTILVVGAAATAGALVVVGATSAFWVALSLIVWNGFVGGLTRPVRQSYLHQVIPSAERATVISFDSLFGNAGSVGGQAGLGYLSETRSLSAGFVAAGAIAALAVPLLGRIRRLGEAADRIARAEEPRVPVESPPAHEDAVPPEHAPD
jgi:MFS family permease